MDGHYKNCPGVTDCLCDAKRYFNALCVALIVIVFQVTLGLQFEIVSLITDGEHTAIDSANLFAMCVGAVLIKFSNSKEKVRDRLFFIIVGLLLLFVVMAAIESLDRLFHQEKRIPGFIMAFGGFVGFLGNHIQYRILQKMPEEFRDYNHEGASLHVWADRAMSIIVCFGGLAIEGGRFLKIEVERLAWIDPSISLVIVGWISWKTIELLKNRHKHNH